MKHLLLIIPLMLFLSSCSEREIDATTIQDRNGVYYAVNEEKPYSGKVTAVYPNSQLMAEITYENGKEDGLARKWYANGQLMTETTYENGVEDGLAREWRENGQLKSETTYENGVQDGLAREWRENGQLKSETTYENGVEKPSPEKQFKDAASSMAVIKLTFEEFKEARGRYPNNSAESGVPNRGIPSLFVSSIVFTPKNHGLKVTFSEKAYELLAGNSFYMFPGGNHPTYKWKCYSDPKIVDVAPIGCKEVMR